MALILVIDDEPAVAMVARRTLEHLGHRVVVAPNGASGLHEWEVERADLVLLDLVMPGVDGLDVLAQLRALDPRVPVVVMSGRGEAEVCVQLNDTMPFGPVGILSKPFTIGALAFVVEESLVAHRRSYDATGEAAG